MSKMKFVAATKEDLAHCLEMIEDFYSLDDYPFNRNKVKKNFGEITSSDHLGKFWLIIHEDGSIIGYLIFTYGYSFEYGGRDAFIDEFYLKSDFRNQGYGTKVLVMLEEVAVDLGVNAIHLEVEKTNSSGNKLYAKSGFIANNRSLLTKITKK